MNFRDMLSTQSFIKNIICLNKRTKNRKTLLPSNKRIKSRIKIKSQNFEKKQKHKIIIFLFFHI